MINLIPQYTVFVNTQQKYMNMLSRLWKYWNSLPVVEYYYYYYDYYYYDFQINLR